MQESNKLLKVLEKKNYEKNIFTWVLMKWRTTGTIASTRLILLLEAKSLFHRFNLAL